MQSCTAEKLHSRVCSAAHLFQQTSDNRDLCRCAHLQFCTVEDFGPRVYSVPRLARKIEMPRLRSGDDHASSRTIVIVQHPTEPFAAANGA